MADWLYSSFEDTSSPLTGSPLLDVSSANPYYIFMGKKKTPWIKYEISKIYISSARVCSDMYDYSYLYYASALVRPIREETHVQFMLLIVINLMQNFKYYHQTIYYILKKENIKLSLTINNWEWNEH